MLGVAFNYLFLTLTPIQEKRIVIDSFKDSEILMRFIKGIVEGKL